MLLLQEGRTSIVATPYMRVVNGKLKCTPILSLRARNTERGVVNLLSFETSCASLTEEGCYFDFEHRPSGGKHLIPKKVISKEKGEYFDCKSDYSSLEKLDEWLPFQNALKKLVRKYTGKDADEVYRKDVKNFIRDFATKDLNNIPAKRLKDMAETLQELILAYPKEAFEATTGLSASLFSRTTTNILPNAILKINDPRDEDVARLKQTLN